MSELRSLCVFCGSRLGADPAYEAEARRLGRLLAESSVRLVYGAGSTGIMGAVADACLGAGGHVIGVVPGFLVDREVAHDDLSERIVVPDMHTRKARMFELSDAFCVLPGGIGTLEEAFEMATWKQLGRHGKPLLVLNVNGYWDELLALVDKTISGGFADESTRALWTPLRTVEDVLPTARSLLAVKQGGPRI